MSMRTGKRTGIELHLDHTPLVPACARRIKAMGGAYSECRGYQSTRFVHLPMNRKGVVMANGLLGKHSSRRPPVIILRGRLLGLCPACQLKHGAVAGAPAGKSGTGS